MCSQDFIKGRNRQEGKRIHMRLLKAKIHGHVQGVGFRFEAAQRARELGLVGFVRNERDRTVYVEAQGMSEQLREFEHWLERHGSAGAKVTRVEKNYSANLKNFGSFKVSR